MRLFVTAVLAEEPWKFDSKVVPLPWRPSEDEAIRKKIATGGLTLGFYECDGNVMPHPPITRGIDIVVSTLKQNGHTVVPWTPYKHAFASDLINSIYTCDGGTVTLPLSPCPLILLCTPILPQSTNNHTCRTSSPRSPNPESPLSPTSPIR